MRNLRCASASTCSILVTRHAGKAPFGELPRTRTWQELWVSNEWDANRWSRVRLPTRPGWEVADVSCIGTTFCLAATDYEPSTLLQTTQRARTSWAPVPLQLPPNRSLEHILNPACTATGCTVQTRLVALSGIGAENTAFVTTAAAPGTWTYVPLPVAGPGVTPPWMIGCAVAGPCMSVGDRTSVWVLGDPAASNPTWTTLATSLIPAPTGLVGLPRTGLQCAPNGPCTFLGLMYEVAAGQRQMPGYAMWLAANAVDVSTWVHVPFPADPTGWSAPMLDNTRMTCRTTTSCIAEMDYRRPRTRSIVFATNAAATGAWRELAPPPIPAGFRVSKWFDWTTDGGENLGYDCARLARCTAIAPVERTGSKSEPDAVGWVALDEGAGTWRQVVLPRLDRAYTQPRLSEVQCPSRDDCFALAWSVPAHGWAKNDDRVRSLWRTTDPERSAWKLVATDRRPPGRALSLNLTTRTFPSIHFTRTSFGARIATSRPQREYDRWTGVVTVDQPTAKRLGLRTLGEPDVVIARCQNLANKGGGRLEIVCLPAAEHRARLARKAYAARFTMIARAPIGRMAASRTFPITVTNATAQPARPR